MQTYTNLQETVLQLFVEIYLHLSKPVGTLARIVDRLPAGEQQGTHFEYFGECLEVNSASIRYGLYAVYPSVFVKRWDIASDGGSTADTKSLIQTIGRAARNVKSRMVLYADKMTDSITRALSETERRRNFQIAYNREHNIIPQTIQKPIREKEVDLTDTKHLPKSEIPNLIIELEAEMQAAAEALDFEREINMRDVVKKSKVQAAG